MLCLAPLTFSTVFIHWSFSAWLNFYHKWPLVEWQLNEPSLSLLPKVPFLLFFLFSSFVEVIKICSYFILVFVINFHPGIWQLQGNVLERIRTSIKVGFPTYTKVITFVFINYEVINLFYEFYYYLLNILQDTSYWVDIS